MANVDNPNGFKAVASFYSAVIPTWRANTAASTAIAVGDMLKDNGSGLVIPATAGDAIVGLAREAATATEASKTIVMVPALEGIVFEAQTSGTAGQTDVWETVDLEGTTGIQEVNEDTTSSQLTIIGFTPSTSIGANSRVQVIVTKSGFSGRT